MFFFREKCRLTSFLFVDQPNRGLTLTWFFPLPTDNHILTCQKYASSKNLDHQWSVTRGQDIQKSLGYVPFLRVNDPEKLIPAGLQITPEKWLGIPSKELRFGPGEAENVPDSIWAPFVNSYQVLSPQKLTSPTIKPNQLSPFISSMNYVCFHRDYDMLSLVRNSPPWKNPIRGTIPGLPTHEVGGKTAIEPVLPIVALPHEVSHEGSNDTLRCGKPPPAHRLWRSAIFFLKEQRFMAWSCDSRAGKNWRLFWDNSPYWPYYGGLRFG